jgi:hypothetical protein
MTQPTAEKRVFKIKMSKRCFRFKPEALMNHAPQAPGVYEFVVFDEQGNGTVLYVGLALPPLTIHEALRRHLENEMSPKAEVLFQKTPDVYFDYVAGGDIESTDDLKDIAFSFCEKHKPVLNEKPWEASGRYASVETEEIEQGPGGGCRS